MVAFTITFIFTASVNILMGIVVWDMINLYGKSRKWRVPIVLTFASFINFLFWVLLSPEAQRMMDKTLGLGG